MYIFNFLSCALTVMTKLISKIAKQIARDFIFNAPYVGVVSNDQKQSLYCFDNSDGFKSAQILHHYLRRNWAIDGGDGIADVLCGAPAVHKIQDFVGILTTGSAQSLILQESDCSFSFGAVVVGEIVIAKGRHWSFDSRVAKENQPAIALGRR